MVFSTETFSWTVVEQVNRPVQMLLGHRYEAGVFGDELTEKAIGVLVVAWY